MLALVRFGSRGVLVWLLLVALVAPVRLERIVGAITALRVQR
jgi:hypothetical protein